MQDAAVWPLIMHEYVTNIMYVATIDEYHKLTNRLSLYIYPSTASHCVSYQDII